MSAPEPWKIDFYADQDGSFPVQVWLDSVPDEVRGKVLARINLLKKIGRTRMARHEARLAARRLPKLIAGPPAKEKKRR